MVLGGRGSTKNLPCFAEASDPPSKMSSAESSTEFPCFTGLHSSLQDPLNTKQGVAFLVRLEGKLKTQSATNHQVLEAPYRTSPWGSGTGAPGKLLSKNQGFPGRAIHSYQ